MNKLNLGSIQLPLQAATKTFAILAKRGAGKSYTAAVMAEEFFKNNIPFIVFDPIDVWWGLRFSADGVKPGLPVVVFGVEHSDIPLTRNMGEQIAHAIVEKNISCIISTFGMSKNDQRHLITEFSQELLVINRTPRHIFIEEAHEFIPQRITGGMGVVFNAVSNLVVMGRNRGLGVTLINQRAATINKDVLTQLDTLLAFRNTSPQDRSALKDWVEFHSAEGDFKAFIKSLPSLPTGQGWIWSPEFMEVFERIKIRTRETFHPDREKLGINFELPKLNSVNDIKDFIVSFNSTSNAKDIELPKNWGGINVSKGMKTNYINKSDRVLQDITVEITNQLYKQVDDKYKDVIKSQEIKIKLLSDTISKIVELVREYNSETPSIENKTSNNELVEMWINKIGQNGASRILRFLADKPGLKFTRSQIGLATQMSSKGGSFLTYISTLKRNNLITEYDGLIQISQDLL